MNFGGSAILALAVCCLLQPATAQNALESGSFGGVYTCVDGKGRKLTSDRPIAECNDREQRVLNPSGTLRTTLAPNVTPQERIKQEAKERQELEARNRVVEERRRDRALLMRYPTRAPHDKERAEALEQVAVVISAAKLRLLELESQRQKLETELEFYKKEPNKAPEYLRHQYDDNLQNAEAQQRFLQDQEEEVRRVNARFDEELARLKQLWSMSAAR